jgi:exonuclease SbcD
MRIVHTSDWHAGRVWKGRDRLPELQDVLEHLGDFIERERMDLVLMSGDVFDSAMPAAEAERAVTAFFKRLGRARVPSVLIAGNHDSAARLEAWGMLAELVGVHVRGVPRDVGQGGVVEIDVGTGERARVAALPFARPGQLVEALTVAHDLTEARQQYASLMQEMLARLATGFSADAVNLVVAHTDLAGAVASGSERVVTLGEGWAATPQALPSQAHYVAMGHIHRPQTVPAAAAPTRYAGSPLQLDFGEAGEAKSFVLIEAEPGLPARVSCVPYQGLRELGQFKGTWAELEAAAEALRRFGYLRALIRLEAPDPDLGRRARRLLPNLVVVDVELPADRVGDDLDKAPATAPPRDHFAAFYRRAHRREPSPETLALFEELYMIAGAEE